MIYCIDIDGVLAETKGSNYQNSIPNMKAINKVNRLYDEGHTIKIFTGRGSRSGLNWREFTEKQLRIWGIKYHELIMGKPHADVFVDDRGINAKDWIMEGEHGFSL